MAKKIEKVIKAGDFVIDKYDKKRKKVHSIQGNVYFIGKDHEPVIIDEIEPVKKKREVVTTLKFMPKSKYEKLSKMAKLEIDMKFIKKLPVSCKTNKTFGQIARQYLPKYAELAK